MTRRKKKKKSTSHFIQKAIIFFNGLFAFALLLSYLASVIDPHFFWPIASFGLAYPFLLFFNIIFVVYWLINSPRFALISLFAVVVGWKFLMSYVGFRESMAIGVPKSSQNFIRMMTYNVHSFKQFGDKNNRRTKEIFLDILEDEQPDIICFQEFFTRERTVYNFKKSISDILHTPYHYYNPVIGNQYETIGLAIFSKYPIVNTGLIQFEKKTTNASVFVDIKANNRVFRVYNVHLQSIRFKPEDYKYLDEVKTKMETDVESSLRIGGRLKRAFIKRSLQVQVIKEHAKKCNTPYIIAGDFNDTPVSYAVNEMLSGGLVNAFRERGSGFGVTYNGDFPNFQIDYILATPQFAVKNYRIIKRKVSDHYAIRSDLELK